MLKVREDHVRSVLDEARRRLGEITKDQGKYAEVLLPLIVQGLFQIMEAKVTIRGRQVDIDLIEQVLPRALKEYKDQTGKDSAITLDKESFLPANTCGGVELCGLGGRIRVSFRTTSSSNRNWAFLINFFFGIFVCVLLQVPNTLESRLELISAQLIPEIRTALFGRNVNRKFTD